MGKFCKKKKKKKGGWGGGGGGGGGAGPGPGGGTHLWLSAIFESKLCSKIPRNIFEVGGTAWERRTNHQILI